ncbi:MAG: FAD-dependent oxidoreductase [Acidimicrobiales bacterium]|nr:FAD-dependent oxidoreductase [Acidimicrobiales bacterium]MYG89653.1 FAD-dependent oxidoreductase [Acidimicrobiales bacterium]MYI27354.1 FAD-dependent oxidoreductase [Acidimicrobiales bacterium]
MAEQTSPGRALGDRSLPDRAASKRTIPDRAEVVVVGGGVVGCAVAYHLVRRGISDVLLLEQNQLTSGTTWHAAGLAAQLKSTYSLTKLATYTVRLFEALEDETGQATGFRAPGSISVASDAERWEEILRGASMGRSIGVESRELDMDELSEMWPLMRTDDLVGALYLPDDGMVSPVDVTMALAKGARARGCRIIEGVAVAGLETRNGAISGVRTELTSGVASGAGGDHLIETEAVVLATGMWTRHLAAQIGVNVPLQACEHFYVVTEPLEGLDTSTPIVRDPTNYTYFKEETGKLMVGFFEPEAKVWRLDGIPRDFKFGTLPEDWDHVGPVFERSCHRVPTLADCGVQLFFNGPESFTPDGTYYLGEAPEVDGCFVAAGFNSVGIQSAGGAGWVLADWIADRHPPMDLCAVDIRRAMPFQADNDYLAERISESLGLLYAMHWPFFQYTSARDQRRSALHDAMDAAGAVFGETAGWERANWFAEQGQEREYRYSYGKQNWFKNSGRECDAVRNGVAVFDQSSFVKFTVRGPDALDVLDTLSVASVDVPAGRAVYTQWCNERGGIEADLTVTRLGDDDFWVVTSAACQTRDWAWLRRHCRGRDVDIADVTDEWAVLGLMGPHSRDLLSRVTDAALDNESFGFGDAQHIDVACSTGPIAVLAVRMSYVGELGWELYVPNAGAVAVYEALRDAAEDADGLELAHAGYHAMNTLRLECGYRHWGHDISDEDTPLEAGLGFAIAWDKPRNFIGRAALEAQRQEPRTHRLVQFRLEDPDVLAYHDEPIRRDGELVGRVTSAMWSYTEDRCLAMGYVTHPTAADPEPQAVTKSWLDAGSFDIEIAGRRIAATPSIRSFYDPTNQRVRL